MVENNSPGQNSYPQLARHLKAAGDPLRLEILRVLARDSYGVLELSRIFDMKQSGMSHHLKVLSGAGLVATRREGNSIFYRRAAPARGAETERLQTVLFSTLDRQPLPASISTRLADIQSERATASKQFFAENAAKFREQQDLIASFPVYAEQVQELLAQTPLPGTACALEVGPGEGEFLAVLAPRFEQVVALDNAAAMLEQAQAQAAREGLDNVTFVCGDTGEARRDQLVTADCVVVNMVLHHTPSPAAMFQDINALLRPGGAVLITDLCRHDQNWARTACGDLWLGFDPEDFSNWAASAGLEEGQSVYFALRNGFQIQLRQFFKRAATG
ncbi:metalloregulator ArsR/SmtB family transcription factor [Exilibacterium tricleocarpae]|uniref:Metalloregulator ArsR/SmtB family transcription factor n=1 Tax=Exilibacterium tricleocarpae TaxID=2591008 RepID=A0A545SXG1_9GAMM|nr:metalloregulator ArsR/SmtB family transcription factor [Exilibacterium tricleocarpae]TQV69655.1 metalloregulator ArsR/SmtB family transcription factor [Exilibacterium tricleocarpae]